MVGALKTDSSTSYGIFQSEYKHHAHSIAITDELSPAYYQTHPPFNKSSNGAINAVGPAALAVQYGEVSTNIVSCTKHSITRIFLGYHLVAPVSTLPRHDADLNVDRPGRLYHVLTCCKFRERGTMSES